MSTIEAKKIVKKYAQRLRKNQIPFSAIYLFGSFGKARSGNQQYDVAMIKRKQSIDL